MSVKSLFTIGRREKIDLPDLNLAGIDAKVDTGAYTSALHCHKIKVDDEKNCIKFYLLDPDHPQYEQMEFSFSQFSTKEIKNSFGTAEKRFIIETPLKIFNKTILTEFSLSDRSNMKYPILLGRKFISQGFLVDVNSINLSYKQYETSHTLN